MQSTKEPLIYMPFDQDQICSGGPMSFMNNLQIYLERIGYPYAHSIEEAHSIFFPISFPYGMLNKIKQKGGYIIQRLDGIYYPSKHGLQYKKLNQDIQKIYINYADHIIFQSQYSRKQCLAMLGEPKSHSLILNGVHKHIFYPGKNCGEIRNQKMKFITTGYFRNLDMIEPVVLALDLLRNKFDFEFTVVGPVVNSKIESYLQRDYIHYIDLKTHEELAALLRSCHIFLYSHLNPPCPNSVIEAVSCGLPVVGFDSGSMSELLFFSKELLAPVSNDLFQRYEDFDYKKLSEKICQCVNDYTNYKKLALENCLLYSFEECGKKYVEIFKRFSNVKNINKTSSASFKEIKKKIKKKVKQKLLHSDIMALSEEVLLEKSPHDLTDFIEKLIKKKTDSLSPFESLQFLFDIENRLYNLEGQASVRYGNGIHTKHMHIKYHDFFIERITAESKVLDIGCGNGALTYDIASKIKNTIICGIDLAKENIETAKAKYKLDNITYLHGDALQNLPNINFDIIVLSNFLEHIEKRIELLTTLKNKYCPKKFLIRVPVFERDWRVPLKREIGVDYRLDATHYIEYTCDEFFNEMKKSGLYVAHYQINWGEIWAEAVPNDAS